MPDKCIWQQTNIAHPCDRPRQQRSLIIPPLEQTAPVERDWYHEIRIANERRAGARHMTGKQAAHFSAVAMLEWQNQIFCVFVVAECCPGPGKDGWRGATRWADTVGAALVCVGEHHAALSAAGLGHKSDPAEAVCAEQIMLGDELMARRALRRQQYIRRRMHGASDIASQRRSDGSAKQLIVPFGKIQAVGARSLGSNLFGMC
jgi:hypothetical protein